MYSRIISVFLYLPGACYDLQLLYSCNSHLCTVIQMSFLRLVLLPPQLAPKTFCSELEDKSYTVPSLRLYICHCFHFDSGIRVSHHGVCSIVFRALGKGSKSVDVLWRPCTLQTFTRSSLFSLTLLERQSTEDSPQDYSGHGDAACVFAYTWKQMSLRNSQDLTYSVLREVSHKAHTKNHDF